LQKKKSSSPCTSTSTLPDCRQHYHILIRLFQEFKLIISNSYDKFSPLLILPCQNFSIPKTFCYQISLNNASRKYSRIIRARVFKFFTDLNFYAGLRAIYISDRIDCRTCSFSRPVPQQQMFPLLSRTYIGQSQCLASRVN
jgi:hypothetical protein